MAGSGMLRLGTGAGFSADRLDPAVDLVERGNLDAIVFECLGERTLAFAYRDRVADAHRGYTPLLERRMRAILPAEVDVHIHEAGQYKAIPQVEHPHLA